MPSLWNSVTAAELTSSFLFTPIWEVADETALFPHSLKHSVKSFSGNSKIAYTSLSSTSLLWVTSGLPETTLLLTCQHFYSLWVWASSLLTCFLPFTFLFLQSKSRCFQCITVSDNWREQLVFRYLFLFLYDHMQIKLLILYNTVITMHCFK